jgi:hypothetical protein
MIGRTVGCPTPCGSPTPRQGQRGTPLAPAPMDSLSALRMKSRRGSGFPLAGAPPFNGPKTRRFPPDSILKPLRRNAPLVP